MRFEGQKGNVEKVRIALDHRRASEVGRDAERKHPDLVRSRTRTRPPPSTRTSATVRGKPASSIGATIERWSGTSIPATGSNEESPEKPKNPSPQETALNAIARPKTTQSALRIIEPSEKTRSPRPSR